MLNGTADSPTALEYTRTGNTTGSSLSFAHDAAARDWWLASTFLFNAWIGLHVGVPYLFLWGAPESRSPLALVAQSFNLGLLLGRHQLPSATTSSQTASDHLQALNEHSDCHPLIGYASEIYAIAVRSLSVGPRVNRLFKAVVTTAEALTPAMRARIERAFGCHVWNRYGSRAVGDIASESTHQRGLHVNPLFTYLEVADAAGRPLPHAPKASC
ncbi:MAG: hypothetical protein ABW321_06120 [Polyangiales bacterium]